MKKIKTFAEWVIALTRGYIKATGKEPDKLSKLKINMEAGQKVRDQEKILTPDFGKNKPWYKVEGELTHNDKIDWLVKNVDQNPVNLDQQAIPPKETLEAMLKDGRGDLIDHFFEMHTKKLGGKPQINIDTSDLKHPELVEKMMTDKKLKPTLVKTEAQIKSQIEKQNKESIANINRQMIEEDRAIKDMYRTAGPRTLDEDAGYLAEFLADDAGKFLDDLPKTEQTKFYNRAKNALIRHQKKNPDPEDFAGGGIAGMLGEPTYQDDNHRVPYGGGGAGKPPITFTLQGGGSYGSNEIGPGLDLTQSGYGFDLGTNIDLPFGFSFTGGVGIGRGKGEVDYNDQNVFTSVDETKLGDKWNVGLKWSKEFNEGGRVPFSKGKRALEGLAKIMDEFFPGTTKIGQTSKPMAEKTQLKKAVAGFQKREEAAKLKELKTWENPDKVRAAVDDIFSTGDYKMDAQMASEALVENNPKAFGNKLYDDLDDRTRMKIYGAVLETVQSDLGKMLQLKRTSKSKPIVVDDDFGSAMAEWAKKNDPEGYAKIQKVVDDANQKLELKRFKTKGKKGHAEGGRVPMWLGGGLGKGKGLLRKVMRHHEETGTTGLTGSEMLKLVNPKQFNKMLDSPEGIPAIAKEMIEKYTKEMKADRVGAVEHSLGLAKKMKTAKDKSKEMDKITEALTKDFVDKGMDKEMVEGLIEMFLKARYPDYQKVKTIKALPNVTDEAILELENIQKNLATKDRKLNASGGLAGMLGE